MQPREIDVCAMMTNRPSKERLLVRAYNVVECKWAKSKPWVVFTSQNTRMMPTAVIAQTLGSYSAEAAMWANAGDKGLAKLQLFGSPEKGAGFSGRQVLTDGSTDRFYDSIRSVVSASNAIVESYDMRQQAGSFPTACVVAFPVIVIEGDLFEASYSNENMDMKLTKVRHSRCHWRGSAKSRLLTTVDIVTKDGLQEFAECRASDIKALIEILEETHLELFECYNNKDMAHLRVKSGSTGMGGRPHFLQDLINRTTN